LNNIIHKNPT